MATETILKGEALVEQLDVQRKAQELSVEADVDVEDQPSYDEAAGFLKSIKAMRKKVGEYFDPILKSINASLKTARDKKKEAEAPLITIETVLKDRLITYTRIQEKKEREAQARRDAEFAAGEQERKLSEAIEAEKAGASLEKVNQVLAQPTIAPAPTVAPTLMKASGVSMRDQWSAEIFDFQELVNAVAAGKASIEAIKPNEPFLNAEARGLKAKLNYPGVRAVNKPVMSAGTR